MILLNTVFFSCTEFRITNPFEQSTKKYSVHLIGDKISLTPNKYYRDGIIKTFNFAEKLFLNIC